MVDRTAQDIANQIGAGIRNVETAHTAIETALNAGSIADAFAALETAKEQQAATHSAALDAFNYANDELNLGLDMDLITGNHESTKGLHTDGGGPKPSSD